ncbi:hypothetical protein INT45_003372 [Circinella minor]|uniref:Uncharacterized protein n=1 Tax=Circinella minor TaxID=1195481 RepID=A0A8H7SDH8_9FUNG|nr:hypothetical protein INT45_003372 [Circinella minor]
MVSILITIALKLSIQLKAISMDSSSLAVASSAGNAKAEPSAVAPPAAVAAATAGSSISSPSSSNSSSITTKQEDIIIAENADVSKTGEKHAGNVTYYEHSVNYKIPQTIRPGKYNVIFYDKSTDTQLDVPIEIRSAAIPNTPRSGSGSSSGGSTKGDTINIYAASGVKTTAPLSSSSFSISLFCVFIAATTVVSAII